MLCSCRSQHKGVETQIHVLAAITAISPEKLIFLNESGVTTAMTRQWGRAPKGERINEATPQGRWKVLTTLGAMSLRGIDSVMTVESATAYYRTDAERV